MPAWSDRERVVAFGAALSWQGYAVILAPWQAPTYMTLFAGLGGPLPAVTRGFLATFHYWWGVPVLFAALSFDVLRRRDAPLSYFSTVLIASAVTALLLHTWLHEAIFAPLFTVLRKIG